MPAALTHKAIMLLARERLADLRDRLQVKVAGGGPVTDLEHRVLYLAKKAHEMMSDNSLAPPSIVFPTDGSFPAGFGRGVSRFAVMGAMGPDITGMSALLAPGQAWVFDTVHKGTPDENRELVVARTTDLALELWRQAATAIDARTGPGATPAAKESARRALRAYVLGHLCHVAGDAISHPFVHDLEWHLGITSRSKFSHAGGEGSLDAAVAHEVFLRPGTREGQNWSVWWPAVDDVPQELFAAYDAALDAVYRARVSRPTGFGEFEERFTALAPPPLTVDFVRDGYSLLRNGILAMGYDWGYWRWWGFLIPAVVPLMALFPLALALPAGKAFLTTPAGSVGERGFFEIAMLPLALSSVIPLFYGIWIAGLTSKGVEGLTGIGITSAIVSFIAAITFFATLGVSDLAWWFRWFILFGVPLVGSGFFSIEALANLGIDKSHRRALTLIYASPLIVTAAFLILFLLIAVGVPALLAGGAQPMATTVIFAILTVLVVVGVAILWFYLPPKLRDARIPEHPEAFPATRPHFVRLFDDGSLFHGADAAVTPLSTRAYPSGRRQLLKLWWEGTGDLYVRSRRTLLEFSFTSAGAQIQIVPTPITPMTAAEYAQFLTRTVRDPANAAGKLKAAVVFATDTQYELPAGATFADGGDPDRTVSESSITELKHDADAEAFQKLGTTQDGNAFVLWHAPKAVQAIRFGRGGPAPFDPREDGSGDGPGTVRSDGNKVFGDATFFRSFFSAGDQIRAGGQARAVTLVRSDTELVVSSSFNPAIGNGTSYERVGSDRELAEGYGYVTHAAARGNALGGGTLMDFAGDFSALLCLGAAPHLLGAAELSVPGLAGKHTPAGGAVDATVTKVQQVFRNWCLDRRRVNEWRMLVAGGAVSEKGEAADGYDSAMPAPRDPAWRPGVVQGEQVSLDRGWVRVLREWLTMAAQPGQNAADPVGQGAGPTAPRNRDLSRALAFLLDMPDPVVVH